MADFERRTKRYPTDLTDEEWALMAPLLPGEARTGRRRTVDLREVINALRYLVRAGAGWRMLPRDFPPWQTVYWWFRRLMRRFLFQTIHDLALMLDRERVACEASPSGAIIDSQSLKAPAAAGGGGYDAAKRTKGRKRHIVVDTDGRLLLINLTPADVQDAAGAEMVLAALRKRWPWVKHLFADGAYDRGRLMDKAAFLGFIVEVVRRSQEPGFHVLPRRWVVERTFGWMTRWRRLVRDYEGRLDVSTAMIHIAMGAILIRRIAHPA